MIVKRIYTRARSLFFISALSAATMLIPATAMAALTAQDQANLTASFQSLSSAWVQSDVEQANSILSKTEYVTSDWKSFFDAYFTSHPLTKDLNNYLGYPVTYWYDDILHKKLQDALAQSLPARIEAIVSAHPTNLGQFLNNDKNTRESLINYHAFLNQILNRTLVDAASRDQVYAFLTQHILSYPQLWKSPVVIDTQAQPFVAAIRGQLTLNLVNSLPLTSERKTAITQTTGLTGRKLDIWNKYSLIVSDNNGLDDQQLSVIDTYLGMVPTNLHYLGSISVNDLLGNSGPDSIAITRFSGVNIVGTRIGEQSENQFPDDIAVHSIDMFSSFLVHEVNHMVAAYSIYPNPVPMARQGALINQAGSAHMNYLRSMIEDGYFVQNPQEFFASMSNQWFANTALMLELGLSRWNKGYKEPINQFLFFAEVHAQGGNEAPFFTNNNSANIVKTMMPVKRDAHGHINELTVNGKAYKFVLDVDGNVTDLAWQCLSYTATNSAHVTAQRATKKLNASWKYEYFAKGSNQSLGTVATASTTLKEDPKGYFTPGQCPAAPTPPVINTITNPVVKIVGSTASDIQFEVSLNGTASDINNDIDKVKFDIFMGGVDCAGTTSFSCTYPLSIARTSLPLILDNISQVSATDKTGLSSDVKKIANITLPAPSAPVINTLSDPSVKKISEDAVYVVFDITVTGTASDVDSDLSSVNFEIGADQASCSGTGNFTCVVRKSAAKSSLPLNIDNTGKVTGTDKTGLSSLAKVIPRITLSNVSTSCYTATNSAHRTAARATVKYSSLYYAVGSNTYLGGGTTTTSLQLQSPDYWKKVTSCP